MEKNKKHKIVFTGGGTGGHVFPLVSVIREIKKIIPPEELEIYYIGPKDDFSKNYIEKEGVKIKYIYTGKVRRYFHPKALMQNLLDIFFKMPAGIIQSFFYLYIFSPDLVFGKGGYGSFPVILMARVFQTPVILHESDVVMGAANEFLQKFSAEVFVSFPKTEKIAEGKMFVVGNPVRKEILQGDKEKAKNVFGLNEEGPVVLILGGSQGSERINDLFLSSATGFLQNYQVLHQCGKNNFKSVSAEMNAVVKEDLRKNYRVYPFFNEEELANAYALADIVISRAGSASIFEISAVSRAGIFLPLPEAAQNHQVKNAYAYSSTGAAIVLEQDNLTSHFFLEKVKELFSPIKQIRIMEDRAKHFSKPRAGMVIASYIKEYLIREENGPSEG